jgi:capsular polysaccharide transport system permease protein
MVAGTDNTPDDATPDGSARSLQDLLTRLPQARSPGAARDTDAFDAPLRTNREYRGAPIPEAAPARAAATETVERPPAPVNEPEVEHRIRGRLLPSRAPAISTGRMIWFLIAFVAPVVLGTIYLFFIMPDQYVTEFRFSVRVPVGNPGATGQATSGSSLSALFGGNPTPGTDLLDNFTVADYVRSPQAARDLNAKINIKAMYNRIGDPLSRVGSNASAERLGRYWKWMVYSDYDVTTGLGVVRVNAFDPRDSLSIANALLSSANQLVNDIGNQSQQDTVRFAKEQVTRASAQVAVLRGQLTALAAQKGTDSPSVGVLKAADDLATNSRTNIAQIQGEIGVLMSQLHNPNAPQIEVLREEMAANEHALSGAVTVANAGATNRYSDIRTELTNALTVLSSAQAAQSYAEATAASQRLYLTTYVRPTLPESSVAPDRWVDLLMLIGISAMVWMVGMLVRNSILEHGL